MGDRVPDVVAQTQGVSSAEDGTEVQVEVVGPPWTPDFIRSLRARARAIMTVGVLPTTVDTIEEMALGDIDKFAMERPNSPTREKRGKFTEATLHTIIVNRD